LTVAETLGKILYRGFVPIILQDRLSVPLCLEQLTAVDLQAVEITCRRPDLATTIAEARRLYPRMAIGVSNLLEEGRLKDQAAATTGHLASIAEAVDADADFLVSSLPFRESTYERYGHSHVLVPAVTTPGEAHQAVDWGAHLVKLFVPYLTGGPTWLKAFDVATSSALPIFTTGAVRFELLPGYLNAGALVCGAGFDTILGPDYRPMQNAFDEEYVIEALQRFVRPIARTRMLSFEHVPFASQDAAAIGRAIGRCLNL
jgi:2-keto-3-deoxy-6-phosphogluconate aldolase